MSQRNEADAPRGAGDAFDGNTNAAARGKSVVPGVLDVSEMLDVQLRFGVDEEQVRRDHAISHALAALSRVDDAQLVFFGGTALSRTLLPDLRLSEDIDLVALAPRREVARAVQQELEEALGSTLGVPTFTPTIESARHPLPSVMEVGDARVQIQLLDGDGYPAWSTAIVDLEQRYADAPPARMRSLTPAAFVASKLTAWADRGASRDLYDLWALAERGYVDQEAAAIYARFGQFTSVSAVAFTDLPSDVEWSNALRHQCILRVTPAEAADSVRTALERLG